MGKFVLGHSDEGVDAVYSGGTWQTNLGLNQFNIKYLSSIARTVDLTELVLDITVVNPISIGCVALLNHNLSSTATMRWEIFSDVGRTNSVYLSSLITIGSLATEIRFKSSMTVIPNITQYYLTVTINDGSNADGYMQIGGIFIGKRLYTKCNADYGLTHGVEDNSESWDSDHGVVHSIISPTKRTSTFEISLINYSQGDESFKLMINTGMTKRVFYQFDEDDNKNGIYTYPGELSRLSPLQYPHYNLNNTGFSVREII